MAGSFQLPISVQVSILVISDRLAELQHLAVVFSRLSSHLQVPDYGPLYPPSPLPPSTPPPSSSLHPIPPYMLLLLQYMNTLIRAMYEAWEGVLHMMENKLAGYAAVSATAWTCGVCCVSYSSRLN